MNIKTIKERYSTKWLEFKTAVFENNQGKEMEWDFVSRKGGRKVVTMVCFDQATQKYLVIRQYRVPIQKYVLEFPAGLVDSGEDYATAALRELKEETGYRGEVVSVSAEVVKSPGLSDESTTVVLVKVDSRVKQESEPEETEDITPMWVSQSEFDELVQKSQSENVIIDVLVWMYFLGHNFKV
jgi:8-oxo-dGTP pyrophosphatase MutT (NUDIX family)